MFRAFVATLCLFAVTNAFVPAGQPAFGVKTTALQFGFLKDLGLEKPSWLPDFGGDKKEEEAKAEVPAEDAEASDGEEAAADEAK
jgi:hypothetical protein